MKNLEWTGGYFTKICKEASKIDTEGNLYDIHNVMVGKVPFIPTIIETSSSLHGSWYEVLGLTKEENEKLELSYCHYDGSYYRIYWNDKSEFAWVSYFFCKFLESKG